MSCTANADADGAPRKLLDVGKLERLGWKARIGLREGIESTYRWFCSSATASS
jgi:GDP-L-fucose synthase